MSASSLAVGLAARTLPRGIRDQYREQWLADVRDAPEAGMRPSSIAIAAFAFAVQLDRPFPARRVPTAGDRARRSRFAVGLALSAALLSVSNYPGLSYGALTGIAVYDFGAFFVTSLLVIYAVLAPIAALMLVGGRMRLPVILLVLASTGAIVQRLVDGAGALGNGYATPGALAHLASALLIVAACGILWRPTAMRSLWAPILGGFAVWSLTAIGVVYAVVAWAARTPLVWGPLADPAYYQQWLELKAAYEALVLQILWVAAFGGLALGILVFVVGRLMSERRATALAVAVGAIVLLGASGVFVFLEVGIPGTVEPVLLDPLRLFAQLVLTAVTFFAVGGVRYLPRVGHRHDVKGTVELL